MPYKKEQLSWRRIRLSLIIDTRDKRGDATLLTLHYNVARVIYRIAMHMIALRVQFSRLTAILPLTVLFQAISIKYLRGEIIFSADK